MGQFEIVDNSHSNNKVISNVISNHKEDQIREQPSNAVQKKPQRYQDQLGEYDLPSYAMGQEIAKQSDADKASKQKKSKLFGNIFSKSSKNKSKVVEVVSEHTSIFDKKISTLSELELFWDDILDKKKSSSGIPKISILNCSKNNRIFSNECEHVAFEFILPKCCRKEEFKHRAFTGIMITFAEKAIQLSKAALMQDEESF